MRKFGAFMMAAVLSVGMVGCGDKPKPPAPPTPPADAPKADAPKADAPKEEPKKDAK